MSFSTLSPELFYAIVDLLPSRALLHLALANRSLHKSLAAALKNRWYDHRYRKLNISFFEPSHTAEEDGGTWFKHPLDVLDEIRLDSRAARHVRAIEFDAMEYDGSGDLPPDPVRQLEQGTYEGSNRRPLEVRTVEALRDCDRGRAYLDEFEPEFLEDSESDVSRWTQYRIGGEDVSRAPASRASWEETMCSGDANPFYVVLLSKCPELESVTIRQSVVDGLEKFAITFLRHAAANRTPLFAGTIKASNNGSEEPNNGEKKASAVHPGLTKLRKLTLHDDDFQEGKALDECVPWLCIPTLRELAFHNVHSTEGSQEGALISAGDWPAPFAGGKCAWTTLLADGEFTPADFAALVREAPALERVVYRSPYGLDWGSEEESFGEVGDAWGTPEEWLRRVDKVLGGKERRRGLGAIIDMDDGAVRLTLERGWRDHKVLRSKILGETTKYLSDGSDTD